jgi:DNA-binding NtrC family response regulator
VSSRPGSFSSGKSGEGGGALPPARLIGLHRHSLTNVLIVGGSEALREQVARAFHRESPLGGGALAIVNCATEEDRLRAALQGWTENGGETGSNPLRAAEQGTLYVDMVEHLGLDTQRLLLALARQIQGEPAVGAQGARAGRLVVGNPRGLAELAADGRFMPALYDALDKVRVELGPSEGPST